jgi:N-acetylglucosamine repressor
MQRIDTRDLRAANRRTPREINRRIALELIRKYQPLSRAELARHMGVGRGLMTSLIRALVEEGALYERPAERTSRGRRPVHLTLRTQNRVVVAVDVRAKETRIQLTHLSHTASAIAPDAMDTIRMSPSSSPADFLSELAQHVLELLSQHSGGGECVGMGIIVPGAVDRRTGRVVNAPQLGWRDVEIREPLRKLVGFPVHIENAAVACALAQLRLGSLARGGASSFAYVSVSDGVGVGLVVNGEVLRGHTHVPGEFGHVPLDLDGPRCLCGNLGCWEAYVSNAATVARYLGRPLDRRQDEPEGSPIMIREIIARARSGQPTAVRALKETARYIGIGLVNVVNTLSPERVIVGGELTAAWDLVGDVIRSTVATRAFSAAAAHTPIEPDKTPVPPRLAGAAALVAATFEGDQEMARVA